MLQYPSKGQITIPKRVRQKLGIQPGENIGFEEKNGVFYIRKSLKNSLLIDGLAGLRHKNAKEQMQSL